VATRVRLFNRLWVRISIDELCDDLRSAAHRHIAIIVGSAASYGHPSACLIYGAVRASVLRSIQAAIRTDSHAGKLVHALLQGLKGDAGARNERLSKEVSSLPFEQFLGCLSATSEDSAASIVRDVCGTNTPNENHNSIVALAVAFREHRTADTVSIITTNYD